jgi:hypothetical protein
VILTAGSFGRSARLMDLMGVAVGRQEVQVSGLIAG